jgi:stearoyl-CoA desaturase (delta-9 desaturase)
MLSPSFGLFAVIYYLLAGLGVNLAYHRVLSHRSLKLPRWLERTLVTMGLPAGTPVQWVGNHRYHHAHADTDLDPHSPVRQGFWYAHVGWYLRSKNAPLCMLYAVGGPARMLVDAWMRPRTNQEHNALAKDVSSDEWYAFLSRPAPYLIALHLHAALPLAVAYCAWGAPGIFAFWLTLALLYNVGDGIDSVSHMVGARLPSQPDASRNNWVMGILTLGEGWHANHHRYPGSARHGLLPGQFDWTWQVIRALDAAGLASDIHTLSSREAARDLCR